MTDLDQLVADAVDLPQKLEVVGKEVADLPHTAVHREQGVGGYDLGLEVRQGSDTAVGGQWPDLLLDHQGDEEAELGDLAGDRLDVDPVDAVLDQVELSAVIEFILGERILDGRDGLLPGIGVRDLRGFGDLASLPFAVVRVQFPKRMDQFVEDAHGESPGTTRGVHNAQAVKRGNEERRLLRAEGTRRVVPCHECPQPRGVLGRRRELLRELTRKLGNEGLLDHVVHDLAGRVERPGQLAGSLARVRIVSGQEVLEHPTKQLRVERHLLFNGSVLGNCELEAFEGMDDAACT